MVVVAEQEAEQNHKSLNSRLDAILCYYCAIFDSTNDSRVSMINTIDAREDHDRQIGEAQKFWLVEWLVSRWNKDDSDPLEIITEIFEAGCY